jgi:FtsX-like permease family
VTSPSTSRFMRGIRAALPLPAALGAGLALQGGQGERAVPVRPAIAGSVAGILGIVGVLGLVHGIDDALAKPRRAGQVWDAGIDVSDPSTVPGMEDQLRGDGQVSTAAELQRVPLTVGNAGLPIYALKPVKGDLSFVVLHGHAPKSPDEISLGPSSLKSLHRTVGGRVQVTGSNGQSATFKIVGTTLLLQTPHSSFDQGAWLPPAVLEKLIDPTQRDLEVGLVATARSGIKTSAFVRHLQKEFPDAGEVGRADLPQDVIYLRNVRNLPRALAAFLALLGIAAVGHALVMTVRRRRHDLAVLRAIGLRPSQSAACIFWQAMTVAIVALAIGVPLGIVVGRLSWRWVADSTPLLYVPPLAALAIVIAIPAAIVLANMLAAYPARRAAGVRPAEVLRTE